jgi:hypothetical protein
MSATINGGLGNVQVAATGLETDDYLYAASDSAAGNIYRWKIGQSGTTWSDIITGTMGTSATGSGYMATGIALSGDVLYVSAYDAGGAGDADESTIFRALTASTGSISDTMDDASTFDSTPQALRVSTGSTKLWVTDTATPRIRSYDDTLIVDKPALTSPADNAEVELNPETGMTADVIYRWSRISTATHYDLWIAFDEDFIEVVLKENGIASTSSTVVEIIGPNNASSVSTTNLVYAPGTTYYWKVRASGPVTSPWSATRSFTVSGTIPFGIISPASGGTEVSLTPTLMWTAYAEALSYELQIAEAGDDEFITPIQSKSVLTTVYAIPADIALEYSTSYLWRVRAVTGEPYLVGKVVVIPTGPWVISAFTTMAEPVEPTPPVVIQPTPPTETDVVVVEVPVSEPQPIPSYLLWTIIGIGAVLVVALIVLIVRTRRVT